MVPESDETPVGDSMPHYIRSERTCMLGPQSSAASTRARHRTRLEGNFCVDLWGGEQMIYSDNNYDYRRQSVWCKFAPLAVISSYQPFTSNQVAPSCPIRALSLRPFALLEFVPCASKPNSGGGLIPTHPNLSPTTYTTCTVRPRGADIIRR